MSAYDQPSSERHGGPIGWRRWVGPEKGDDVKRQRSAPAPCSGSPASSAGLVQDDHPDSAVPQPRPCRRSRRPASGAGRLGRPPRDVARPEPRGASAKSSSPAGFRSHRRPVDGGTAGGVRGPRPLGRWPAWRPKPDGTQARRRRAAPDNSFGSVGDRLGTTRCISSALRSNLTRSLALHDVGRWRDIPPEADVAGSMSSGLSEVASSLGVRVACVPSWAGWTFRRTQKGCGQ